QARTEPTGRSRPKPGVGEVPVDRGRKLPLRFREYFGDLAEREAELAQPDDPVQPGNVVSVVEPVPPGHPDRGLQQPDLVVMVQRPDRQPGGLGQRADLPGASAWPLAVLRDHVPTLGPHVTLGASAAASYLKHSGIRSARSTDSVRAVCSAGV